MLPFLKKKSDALPPQTPPWHPNFRNAEALPDIKVVRTAFFVNGVAIFAVLTVGIYCALQEWQIHTLHRQIADCESRIDRDKRKSEQAVALFYKFQAEEARVREVEQFLKSRPAASALIVRFGQTLPKEIALDSFDLRENGLALRATVRGAPDAAAGRASTYINLLKADPVLAGQFEEVTQTSLSRNPENGRLVIELFLKAKQPVAPPAPPVKKP